jgi:hypothetical protein
MTGFVGVCVSIFHYFRARHDAKMTIRNMGPQEPRPSDIMANYITRDEFNLFDAFKSMALLNIFIFGVLLCMGKGAKCMLWCNKSTWTKRHLKRSAFGALVIIVLSICHCK